MQPDTFTGVFRKQIIRFYARLFRLNLRRPRQLFFWLHTWFRQRTAIHIRDRHFKKGLQVPPVMIFSTTNRCNLNCKGCYIHAQKRDPEKELSVARIGELFREAKELGISMILLAGGEPLLRKDVLEAASRYKSIIFPVFTNGTLFGKGTTDFFHRFRNMIPLLSIEGAPEVTDTRRGEGTWNKLKNMAETLRKKNILFGFSITCTRHNAPHILDDGYISELLGLGARLVIFVEYVPESEADLASCMTPEQKNVVREKIIHFRKAFPAMFLCLPGDEEQYGGCLAAGRGFIHVSAAGNLEPCPFAPWSDVNLAETTLREALQSVFLNKIRENHNNLGESAGGCVLWENRQWVEEQLEQVKKPA